MTLENSVALFIGKTNKSPARRRKIMKDIIKTKRLALGLSQENEAVFRDFKALENLAKDQKAGHKM